jgi:hypothetical protein|tara:strand:+ start:363 stop:545 length:183 start_codon:yes stop_codon:yes gene_type:complete
MRNNCKLIVNGIKDSGVEYEIEGDSDSLSNALFTVMKDTPEFFVVIENVYNMALVNKSEI